MTTFTATGRPHNDRRHWTTYIRDDLGASQAPSTWIRDPALERILTSEDIFVYCVINTRFKPHLRAYTFYGGPLTRPFTILAPHDYEYLTRIALQHLYHRTTKGVSA